MGLALSSNFAQLLLASRTQASRAVANGLAMQCEGYSRSRGKSKSPPILEECLVSEGSPECLRLEEGIKKMTALAGSEWDGTNS